MEKSELQAYYHRRPLIQSNPARRRRFAPPAHSPISHKMGYGSFAHFLHSETALAIVNPSHQTKQGRISMQVPPLDDSACPHPVTKRARKSQTRNNSRKIVHRHTHRPPRSLFLDEDDKLYPRHSKTHRGPLVVVVPVWIAQYSLVLVHPHIAPFGSPVLALAIP